MADRPAGVPACRPAHRRQRRPLAGAVLLGARSPSWSCCSPWRPWWRRQTRGAGSSPGTPSRSRSSRSSRSGSSRAARPPTGPSATCCSASRAGRSAAGLGIAYLAERFKRHAAWPGSPAPLSPRFAVAAVLVAVVGLVGIHDQLAIRQNEAHNLWAYPEMPSNGAAGGLPGGRGRHRGQRAAGRRHRLPDQRLEPLPGRHRHGLLPAGQAADAGLPGADAGRGELACSRPSATTRRPASRARRGSGWSSSTTWPPTRSPRCRGRTAEAGLPADPRLPGAVEWQENGITVALLTVG